MNGRQIVILIVAGAAAFGLLMMWWARAVGFPHHPPLQAQAATESAAIADSAPALGGGPAIAAPAPVQPAPSEPAAQPEAAAQAPAARAAAPEPVSSSNSSLSETTAEKSQRLLQAALAIQRQNTQRYAAAVARWESEKRDAAWAAARERALRAALDSDRITVAPDQLECRATLCRIRLHPPNALEGAHAMRSEIGKQSAVGSDGSGAERALILFIPRAGEKLDG